ncbi:MAG: N-acetylmuramoyl-L-alanine amidase [Anaerolineae bacterium]
MGQYVWKQKGLEVEDLQNALVEKGYTLPRWGADGVLGNETWRRVEQFAGVDSFPTSRSLPEDVTDSILTTDEEPKPAPPPDWVRVDGDPNDVKGYRSWQQIDTIVLHQTGVWMSDTPERFRTLNAHLGILATHPTPIVQVQDFTAYMWHANELNRCSIGIEINGRFPGLAGRYDAELHTAGGPSAGQIQNTRHTILHLMQLAICHRGEIKYILPHRVSNDQRQGDPGEIAWREIGLWAQHELGLCDRGPGWSIGDGRPIPGPWDSRVAYAGYPY